VYQGGNNKKVIIFHIFIAGIVQIVAFYVLTPCRLTMTIQWLGTGCVLITYTCRKEHCHHWTSFSWRNVPP